VHWQQLGPETWRPNRPTKINNEKINELVNSKIFEYYIYIKKHIYNNIIYIYMFTKKED